MRLLLIGLVFLFLLAVGAVFFLPGLIPAEVYREQISQKISQATGRSFTIGGDIELRAFPTMRAQIGEATLGNAPGGQAESMASIGQLDVGLALLPLLSKRIELKSFVLNDAVINLEVDRNGKPNWEFETASAGTPSESETPGDGGSGISELSLGDVRLVNGKVSYTNLQTGESKTIEAINATLELPGLDRPLVLNGNAQFNQQAVDLRLNADTPRALFDGGTTPVSLELSGDLLKASYGGSATFGDRIALAGRMEVNSPSVRALSAWLGNPIAGQGDAFGPMSIAGNMNLNGDEFSFDQAELRFDNIQADGEVSGSLAGDVPYISAALATSQLDLRPYTTPEEDSAGSGGAGAGQPAQWSDEPINASALKAFNADIAFKAEKMLVQNLTIGNSDLAIKVRDGVLTADLKDLALYQGKAVGTMTIDGRGTKNQIASKLTLTNLVLERFLKDAAKTDRFEGKGSFNIDIRGTGVSQREIISSLAGAASINFADGAIRGVDLGKVAQTVDSLIGQDEELSEEETEEAEAAAEEAQGEGEKTKFVEMGSTFAISRGVLNTSDFKFISELLSFSGGGSIDLPKQTMDFRLDPGTNQSDGGLKVGLLVRGPLAKPKITPDPRGLVRSELNKVLGDDNPAGQILDGLLGGGGSQKQNNEGSEGNEPAPSPAQQLFKGLMGQ